MSVAFAPPLFPTDAPCPPYNAALLLLLLLLLPPGDVAERISELGHRVHLLREAGHWVHTDNPSGLFDIMGPSFGVVDLHLERAKAGVRRR